MAFLPVSKEDMQRVGWEQPDFVLVTGDAYVDHPTFGTAIVSRVLEHEGSKPRQVLMSYAQWMERKQTSGSIPEEI
jgi:hypothetical protein